MMIEEIVAILGVAFIGILLTLLIHFIYRMKMVFLAAELSRDIQGIEAIPKPPLRQLVHLVAFLLSKREEIIEKIDEDNKDDDYVGMYR